jgi:hypothetical protein
VCFAVRRASITYTRPARVRRTCLGEALAWYGGRELTGSPLAGMAAGEATDVAMRLPDDEANMRVLRRSCSRAPATSLHGGTVSASYL